MKFQWDAKYFGWKYLNYVIIVLGMIVGLGVWFMPNKWAEPEIAKSYNEQLELLKLRKERLAREAEEKRVQDELGLIYIDPGTNPFPTEPPKDTPEPKK
ncbi:MAG: hypothetical protein EOP18_04085 [Rhizobiaceae bacterium]|nr:MAG: hypothetical protein EOP18_04085 [Rhizobiaceae bacterium]